MRSLVRLVASVLGAGLLYRAWLALVLIAVPRADAPVPLAFNLAAPVVTALGFALGTIVGERLAGCPRTPFPRAYLWPLAGCIIGAVVVYPFGPTLIVFGMFALGTIAVIAERVIAGRQARSANSCVQQTA